MSTLQEELLKELPEFEKKTQQFFNKEITMKEYKGYSGGFGAYAQRGGNAFMLRLRMSQGCIPLSRLQFIVEQCQKYDIQRTHCTTCQTVQLHDLQPDCLTSIMKDALELGIITRGGGGDYPRNVMCSPLSGVDSEEPFDVIPYAQAVGEYLLSIVNKYSTRGGGGDYPRNVMCSPLSGVDSEEPFDVIPYAQAVGEYLLSIVNKYSLPRKLKVAFSNSKRNETHANFRDLGFIANEDHTFDVYCCGGLGNNPMMSVKVAEHVDPKEILYYVHTMVLMFMEHGDYTNRAKARSRYLQKTLGAERIQEEFKEKVYVAKKYLDLDLYVREEMIEKTGPVVDVLPERVLAQKQKGLYTVVYHPIAGMMPQSKWVELYDVLKDMKDVELRLTPQEDLYIINLTYAEAQTVLEHTQDGAQTTFETSVSCIGASTCQVGLRDSNHVLTSLIEACRPYHFAEGVLPRLFISGCTSSCGTNQVGTLGLQGFSKIIDKKPHSAFKLSQYGSADLDDTRFGQELGLLLEEDVNNFFIELGTLVSQEGKTFDQWQKENVDQWQTLLKKYL